MRREMCARGRADEGIAMAFTIPGLFGFPPKPGEPGRGAGAGPGWLGRSDRGRAARRLQNLRAPPTVRPGEAGRESRLTFGLGKGDSSPVGVRRSGLHYVGFGETMPPLPHPRAG